MFKEHDVTLPGFKYEQCKLRELSIKQLKNAPSSDDPIDLMFYAIECGLFNDKGDKVITTDYTIDDFIEACPQSYIGILADAFSELNSPDDEQAIATAKNS